MSEIKLVSFNIRHGKGTDGSVSVHRVVKILKDIQPDLVCLQEVDRFMPRSFLLDQTKWLAQSTGMNCAFAPNLRFNKIAAFGNAILSKFSIIKEGNVLLPGDREKRGLQHCFLAIRGGKQVWLFNTHLGLSRAERETQVQTITAEISKISGPFLLAGDLNAAPEAPELRPLAARLQYACSGNINTFPTSNPRHPFDHIHISSHWLVEKVYAFPSQASDHLPLVCSLRLDSHQP